jgi:hypothetical protein
MKTVSKYATSVRILVCVDQLLELQQFNVPMEALGAAQAVA